MAQFTVKDPASTTELAIEHGPTNVGQISIRDVNDNFRAAWLDRTDDAEPRTEIFGAGDGVNPFIKLRPLNIILDINRIPTSDPGISGAIWRDASNFLKVSP